MRIQKFLALGAVSVLTLSLLSIPAFAHGGHHGYSAHQNSACSVCHAENHSEACYSIHNDTPYCGLGHAGGVCDGSCARSAQSRSVPAPDSIPTTVYFTAVTTTPRGTVMVPVSLPRKFPLPLRITAMGMDMAIVMVNCRPGLASNIT